MNRNRGINTKYLINQINEANVVDMYSAESTVTFFGCPGLDFLFKKS